MQTAPLLFDLGRKAPTSREIAAVVREGGAAALTEAERRADAALYQEIRCRSALNRVEGMPFEWTLNPYRGCTHGCHYCYARRYQAQFELDAGDDFASIIFVKTNLVEVLRRELERPSWTRAYVAVGTATDCYQPIEGHYRLTRRSLETLRDIGNPVGVVTKGPMIVRDTDVLSDLAARAGCSVYMSVPTVDEDAWRRLEPGTAPPLQRLRAVRELIDAGIHAGVLMNPIVPGITSKPALLEATVKAIADHGAHFVGCNVMFLEGGTREHFLRWLDDEFPELVQGYASLYAGKYAPAAYRKEVGNVIGMLRRTYGVSGRDQDERRSGVAAEPRRARARMQPSAATARDARPARDASAPAACHASIVTTRLEDASSGNGVASLGGTRPTPTRLWRPGRSTQ